MSTAKQMFDSKIVYCDVENDDNKEHKFYFGVSETPSKKLLVLSQSKHRNSTGLSNYIWHLKDLKITPKII